MSKEVETKYLDSDENGAVEALAFKAVAVNFFIRGNNDGYDAPALPEGYSAIEQSLRETDFLAGEVVSDKPAVKVDATPESLTLEVQEEEPLVIPAPTPISGDRRPTQVVYGRMPEYLNPYKNPYKKK